MKRPVVLPATTPARADSRLYLLVSDADKRSWSTRAAAAGITLNEFVRRAVNAQIGAASTPRISRAELERRLRALSVDVQALAQLVALESVAKPPRRTPRKKPTVARRQVTQAKRTRAAGRSKRRQNSRD